MTSLARILSGCILLGTTVWGTPVVLDDSAILTRASVVAKLAQREASVSAVYHFNFGPDADGEHEVFVPLPVPTGTARAGAVEKANVFVSLSDGTTPKVQLRPAPEAYSDLAAPAGVEVVWVSFELPLRGEPIQRVTITQVTPLIGEVFYFPGLLPNQNAEANAGRHQLFAYSARRPLHPVGNFEYESFGAEAVAVLHDKQWVGFR